MNLIQRFARFWRVSRYRTVTTFSLPLHFGSFPFYFVPDRSQWSLCCFF